MTRHHEDKAKHMGGQVEVALETRAYAAHTLNFSQREIARKLLGGDGENELQIVRVLIAAGRKKALGAH